MSSQEDQTDSLCVLGFPRGFADLLFDCCETLCLHGVDSRSAVANLETVADTCSSERVFSFWRKIS